MTTQTLSHPIRAFPGVMSELRRTFAAIAAGMQAARDYERFSNRTDVALARDGIAREDIAWIVLERNFQGIS